MKKVFTIATITLVLAGCYNDKQDKLYPSPGITVCDTTNVSYISDIKPIFDAKCATTGCHDATTIGGGYNFSTQSGIQPPALSGQLVKSINWAAGASAMPKNLPKLPQCDIDKITSWVNHGALNN